MSINNKLKGSKILDSRPKTKGSNAELTTIGGEFESENANINDFKIMKRRESKTPKIAIKKFRN